MKIFINLLTLISISTLVFGLEKDDKGYICVGGIRGEHIAKLEGNPQYLINSTIPFCRGGRAVKYICELALQNREGVTYLPNHEKPYTGVSTCLYNRSGQYESEGNYVNGLKDGKWSYYHDVVKYDGMGVVAEIGEYKDGKKEGKWLDFDTVGYRVSETEWHDGKENGKYIKYSEWFKDQKEEEIDFKDGKLDGKYIVWYKSGRKSLESDTKDGVEHGIHTEWYDNAQKAIVIEFKNGVEIKRTEWHKNGQKK